MVFIWVLGRRGIWREDVRGDDVRECNARELGWRGEGGRTSRGWW